MSEDSVQRPGLQPVAPRSQRRPLLIVVAVLMILAGAAGGALAFLSIGETVEAVAARVPIERGQVMGADDFVTVQINPSQELRFAAPEALGELVGQRAAHDIAAGTLVDVSAASQVLVPGSGWSVVGLSLSPGTEPGVGLQVGDRVRIVLVEVVYDCTATPATENPCGEAGLDVAGEVVAADRDPASGQMIVSVQVAEADAALASAAAALGRAALVLDSRHRDG